MAVIKEFLCIEHGEFEGSHPICPSMGCDSSGVTREFRTAPTIRSGMMKQFDRGIRKSSDMMHINNFRTARQGESAFGGEAAKEAGTALLWGDSCRKVMGHSFAELTGIAQKPFPGLTHNNAMRAAATEIGITRNRLPPVGEMVRHAADVKAKSS